MKTLLCAVLLIGGLSSVHAQDWAKTKLEKSPRHGEWVEIPEGKDKLKAFVVYPEVKDKAPVVIVIHEIFGLTDWVRLVCDKLAESGYIAIAPDLLSGQTHEGADEARKAISKLTAKQVKAALDATAAYAGTLPAASDKLFVAGFCWGGGESFKYAAQNPKLNAAFVFYGPAPDGVTMKQINCPVYGFYGEKDARITTAVPKTEEAMKDAGKKYQDVIYADAGHGFMRTGEAPDADIANVNARQEAWQRWLVLMSGLPKN